MPFFKVNWPEETGTRWGKTTDWVIRAPTAEEAIKFIETTEFDYYGLPMEYEGKLTCAEVPIEGPTETILWYGPDK